MTLDLTANDTVPLVGSHDLDNNGNNGPLVQFTWGDVNLGYPVLGSATMTVNPDKQSGTMNIALTDVPSGSDVKETITGAWTCGPVALPKPPPMQSPKPTPTPPPAEPTIGDTQPAAPPPDSPGAPAGATALCNDGTYSYSQHRRGTCSHHHGVAQWLAAVPD